jgi:hypothetical protein
MGDTTPLGGRPQLIGLTLIGPEPLGHVHISTERDVIALYGQNGVGKTRIMRAASAALRGISLSDSWALLHAIAPDPDEFWAEPDPFHVHLIDRAQMHFMEERGRTLGTLTTLRDRAYIEHEHHDEWDDVQDALQEFMAEVTDQEFGPQTLSELIRGHIIERGMAHHVEPVEFEAILGNVPTTGRLVLTPSGTVQAPAWRVYAGISPDTPQSREVLRATRTFWDHTFEKFAEFSRESPEDDSGAFVADLLEQRGGGFPWEVYSEWGQPVAENYLPALKTPSIGSERVEWPDWAHSPLVEIAEVDLPLVRILDDSTLEDADALTRAALDRLGDVVAMYDEKVALLNSPVEELVERLNETATRILQTFLPRSLPLRFQIGDPNEWLRGALPRWQAQVSADQWLPLLELSNAQQRWAALAATLAVSLADEAAPVVFLCDEPEAGLHRGAEAALPRALARVAAEHATKVITATHSPALLDSTLVEPIHIVRSPAGRVVAHRLAMNLRTELDRDVRRLDLGLTTSDLLQLVRAFVIIEGKHDEAVFLEMLGPSLGPGIVFFPVSGAKQIPSLATAHLLWDFTDAEVVVVLDGISQEVLAPVWTKAMTAYEQGDRRAARQALRGLEGVAGGEAMWLRALLDKAIEQHQAHRIHLHTLAEPDIVLYLPCPVPNHDWDEIKQAWRYKDKHRARDIKGFLKSEYGITYSLSRIRKLAAQAPSHDELEALAGRLNEVAAFRQIRTS